MNVMTKRNVAIHEELVLTELLDDLALSVAQCS